MGLSSVTVTPAGFTLTCEGTGSANNMLVYLHIVGGTAPPIVAPTLSTSGTSFSGYTTASLVLAGTTEVRLPFTDGPACQNVGDSFTITLYSPLSGTE